MKRTLILEPENYSKRAISYYRQLGNVCLGEQGDCCRENIDFLVVRLGQWIGCDFLRSFPKLKALITPTTGMTHVDLNACAELGIRVFSLADCREALCQVSATAELTMGLMLALWHNVVKVHCSVVKDKRWDRNAFRRQRQLLGRTLGIVGLGRLGVMVAKRSQSFGMRVKAYDPYRADGWFFQHNVERVKELRKLASESDVLSIHACVREDNRGLVSESVINELPSGAIIVNTARGQLLDESAAVAALERGDIAGIAVDVLAAEHSEAGWMTSPLVLAAKRGLPVLLTPHMGGACDEAMHYTEEVLAELVVKTVKISNKDDCRSKDVEKK